MNLSSNLAGPLARWMQVCRIEEAVPGLEQSGPLVLFSRPETGKSHLALGLLAQLAGHGLRSVLFDMEGELEDDANNPQWHKSRTHLLEQMGAQYVRLILQDLPTNPMYRHLNPTQMRRSLTDIASLIRCIASQPPFMFAPQKHSSRLGPACQPTSAVLPGSLRRAIEMAKRCRRRRQCQAESGWNL